MRILLVSNHPEATEQYQLAFEKHLAQVDVVANMTVARDRLSQFPYHGIAIDIITKIQSNNVDKEALQELTGHFPVLQLKYLPKTKAIQGLYFGHRSHGSGIGDFLENQCQNYIPRIIRRSNRHKKQLNIDIQASATIQSCKTVTIDVSPHGGCFIFSTQPHRIGDLLRFSILEYDRSVLLTGEVRWISFWGQNLKMPGIGIKIVDFPEDAGELFDLSSTQTATPNLAGNQT